MCWSGATLSSVGWWASAPTIEHWPVRAVGEPCEECVREGALRGDHRLQARPRRRKGPCDAEASVRSDQSVEYVRVHIARKRIRCGQPPADGASYGTSKISVGFGIARSRG